jgi:hypothetical protein
VYTSVYIFSVRYSYSGKRRVFPRKVALIMALKSIIAKIKSVVGSKNAERQTGKLANQATMPIIRFLCKKVGKL